jgi:hypothetical protein
MAQRKTLQKKEKTNSNAAEEKVIMINMLRTNKGKKMVQDQTKIMAKAHSGSHQFALSYVGFRENLGNTQKDKGVNSDPLITKKEK